MSEPQSTPESQSNAASTEAGNEAPAEFKAEAAAAPDGRDESGGKPSTSPANIVLYAPHAQTGPNAAAGRARTTRPTSSWATRRASRMVAVAAIAAATGAISGTLATIGLTHILQHGGARAASAAEETSQLRQTVAQFDGALGALKANIDKTSQANAAQLAKATARLDKLDRGQDDTAAKLAKIADAQDKLRMAAAPAPAAQPQPAVAQDVTGSVQASPPALPPKTEARVAPKPPVVEGWVLNRVSRGGAIVASRSGLYEVYPGDPLPGLGPVEAVRYQDGRWVVVTPKGLIIRR